MRVWTCLSSRRAHAPEGRGPCTMPHPRASTSCPEGSRQGMHCSESRQGLGSDSRSSSSSSSTRRGVAGKVGSAKSARVASAPEAAAVVAELLGSSTAREVRHADPPAASPHDLKPPRPTGRTQYWSRPCIDRENVAQTRLRSRSMERRRGGHNVTAASVDQRRPLCAFLALCQSQRPWRLPPAARPERRSSHQSTSENDPAL